MNGLALALDELRALALSPKLAWRRFGPGVDIHRLWGDPIRSGALLRYAAGGKVPRHRHEGTEHIYVLIGAQRDERGEYAAGAHVVNAPGIGACGLEPEGLRGVRRLGASQHVHRRNRLRCGHGAMGAPAWLASGDGARLRRGNGTTQLSRRAHRGPLEVQRPFRPEGPDGLPRLPAAPAGRAGRRRRADGRRGRSRPARTRW